MFVATIHLDDKTRVRVRHSTDSDYDDYIVVARKVQKYETPYDWTTVYDVYDWHLPTIHRQHYFLKSFESFEHAVLFIRSKPITRTEWKLKQQKKQRSLWQKLWDWLFIEKEDT